MNHRQTKHCDECLYDEICPSERRVDTQYTDCCIPIKPLREQQYKAFHNPIKDEVAARYTNVTQVYIKQIKSKSLYWQNHIYF